jgi:Predicted transcription factor, homolog of eukaryotic MBF1
MKNQFSQQLVKIRHQRNLSQDQLASKLFVSRQAISKWEQGETTPDLQTLVQLTDILDVDLNELVSGETGHPEKSHQTDDKKYSQARPMNFWEFLARYWWVLIALMGAIGGLFFNH